MRRHRIHFLPALAVALATSAADAEDHVVIQKDRSFSTAEITIQRGDRIVFQNQDSRTHNVFSRTPGNAFEIKAQIPGQTAAVPFPANGPTDVRCAIHPNMKLTVRVEP
jgi:plastocyanin